MALRCGIIGSIWTVALSLLVSSAVQSYVVITGVTTGEAGQLLASVTENASGSDSPLILIVTGTAAVMGMLALVTVSSLKMRAQLREVLMRVSAVSVLLASLLVIPLLPGGILLLLAAIGMRKGRENPGGKKYKIAMP